MITSESKPEEAQCGYCGYSASYDMWIIVNTAERPDLLRQVQNGTIRKFACRRCGKEFWMMMPLVVYNPGGFPHAVVLTLDRDRNMFPTLASLLRDWAREDWPPGETVLWMPHSIMPIAFKRDIRADMASYTVRPGDDAPQAQVYFDFLERARQAERAGS